MPSLMELTAEIVTAHLSNVQMTSDEMYLELQMVHASLKALETGTPIDLVTAASQEAPKLNVKQAFKKDSVTCMVCGKSGFKTLTRHLSKAHQMKPTQYRKEFNIPSSQSLTEKNYSDSRRAMALELNLGAGLEKARAARFGKPVSETIASAPLVENKPTGKTKARVPKVKTPAPVPAVRVKPAVPAVKTKAGVPMKTTKAAVPMVVEKAPVPANIEKGKVPAKTKQKKTGKK